MGGFPGMELRETSMMIYAKAFAENIAPARTFVSREEIESLRARGLGQGGSEENVVVLEEKGASAPLRFPDEPLRHKILDIVGDLALLGKGLFAHIIAIRSGHKLNLQLVNKILEAAT
jgi:UDP-3-O-[3-hydroxymyristoyl] N-acetylglucosamine deacetylase